MGKLANISNKEKTKLMLKDASCRNCLNYSYSLNLNYKNTTRYTNFYWCSITDKKINIIRKFCKHWKEK